MLLVPCIGSEYVGNNVWNAVNNVWNVVHATLITWVPLVRAYLMQVVLYVFKFLQFILMLAY